MYSTYPLSNRENKIVETAKLKNIDFEIIGISKVHQRTYQSLSQGDEYYVLLNGFKIQCTPDFIEYLKQNKKTESPLA